MIFYYFLPEEKQKTKQLWEMQCSQFYHVLYSHIFLVTRIITCYVGGIQDIGGSRPMISSNNVRNIIYAEVYSQRFDFMKYKVLCAA